MKGKAKRTVILRVMVVIVAVLVILAVTIVNLFHPFRSMRAPYELPARLDGELRIYFLDVGQGDCTVVQFPSGNALVIDAGDGSWENDNKLTSFFNSLQAPALTYVATHADIDHSGGLAELIRTFGADTIYLPAIDANTTSYQGLLNAAETSGAALKRAKRYELLEDGDAYAVFISPYSRGETDDNDASAVLYLRYGEISALFPADISSMREDLLCREYEIDQTLFDIKDHAVRLDDVDILKVAHHGSDSSTSEQWLNLIQPEVAVISCGRGNPYGHPSSGALERLDAAGSKIYRTDELGDLMLSAFPDGTYTLRWDW